MEDHDGSSGAVAAMVEDVRLLQGPSLHDHDIVHIPLN
eukprot:CAMPEP_0170620398 /NCGR_PEP_ID=MMETSP0224-20130122/28037_1 /TAXON_ID=285029 /ORGANISM="Togula jolla, Strain CCCM 725" /LENGTH=37 /DNA_ID= /DNA_START= /DNA_END= /DNA_ORIENTATION=